ncbi:ssDNA endonuclease and repair protein rad10 [Myotisia sp. PD_48]|nr:ssDNA endonuclease and repair protein rad10 [Myotisia sp. PD_48]
MGNTAGNVPPVQPKPVLIPKKIQQPTPQKLQPNLQRIQQPKPQALPSRRGLSSILVSSRQKGNPILNHIRASPWEYADIPADYVVGTTTCVLFLSLKYHRLHPEYIYTRIKLLAGKYQLRILLTMVDIPTHEDPLKELSKTALINNLTLMLCWSAQEAGHYLELFKSSENAQPTAIRSQQPQSYKDSLVDFITTPRSINKSDAASLMSTFGSLQAAITAQPEQIGSVPGWGERKVQQWTSAVQEDFRTQQASSKSIPSRSRIPKYRSREGPGGHNTEEPSTSRPRNADINNSELADEDEEALALLLDAEDDNSIKELSDPKPSASKIQSNRDEEEYPGIMEALAKYRADNG